MEAEWLCPACERPVPFGETYVCPVVDRPDPGAHLEPSRKYKLLREMVGPEPESRS